MPKKRAKATPSGADTRGSQSAAGLAKRLTATGDLLVRGAGASARWARPMVRTASRSFARGLRSTAHLTWKHRCVLVAMAVRAAFWGALVVWAGTASALFSGELIDVVGAVRCFAAGALACAAAVLFAGARHVRWASCALGSLHGASATTLWLMAHGT